MKFHECLNKIQFLKEALEGMLNQFGQNFALSAVKDACGVLNHPQTEWEKEENDCCYCRNVVYTEKEKLRRKKEKINFIDRVRCGKSGTSETGGER